MAWAVPLFKKSQVDKAGEIFSLERENIPLEELNNALSIINNWRSSHSFPLNTFQVTLRSKARAVEKKSLVAQRIKRLSSIRHKLERFPTMKLSQVQDIGGCRAVVSSVTSVAKLRDVYLESDLKHQLVREGYSGDS